jgi:hypothetical protein
MFSNLLKNNYDVEMYNDSIKTISEEREQFTGAIKFILKFCRENNMIVSDIELLLSTKKYWDYIELYSENPDKMSKDLISKLCGHFDKRFKLKVMDYGTEYTIEYNLRRIASIYTIKTYQKLSISNFVSPHIYKYEDITIYLMPQILEIIHLYKKLYDPNEASNWSEILNKIKALEILSDKEIDESLSKKHIETGKTPKLTESDLIGGKSCSKVNYNDIVLDFLKDKHYIVCLETDDAPKVISQAPIEKDFEMIVNYMSKYIRHPITYRKKSVYIPRENRMEQYNIYVDIPCIKDVKRKHIMTLFNNSSYEIVFYTTKNGIKYADPICMLRFSYIYIWFYIILNRVHKRNIEQIHSKITYLKNNIKTLRTQIDIYTTKTEYSGVYIPESLQKKIDALKAQSNEKKNFFCSDF